MSLYKMGHNSICPGCNKDCSLTALTEIVYTFEPIEGELQETAWHKKCFISANLGGIGRKMEQESSA